MTTRSYLLGLTAAAILVAPAAQAASVKEIFEEYNLLGIWAWDCSKPASNSNLFYVNRILGTDAVQRDEMTGEDKRTSVAIINAAAAVGPNEITLNGTRDGKPAEATWRIEGNRQRATEVTIDGQKVISNGRNVASGRELPWTNRCEAAAGDQKETVEALYRLIINNVDNTIAGSGEIKGQRMDYSEKKTPKALVVCINWRDVSPTNYSGGGYIRTGSSANPPKSVEAAVTEAMNNCRATCKVTCVLADRNGQNALQPPADW
jgi:hypothetical protein